MWRTAWPLALYLIVLLKPGSEGVVELRPSPMLVHAECGTDVTLYCEVAPLKDGLSVKYMGWSLEENALCSVDTEGHLSTQHRHSPRPFRCRYSHGHLSLVFHDVQLLDGWNSTYMCKLRSNKGIAHTTTTVQFKEPNKCSQSSRSAAAQIPEIQPGQNGVGSVGAIRTLWCISVLLVILKQ